MFEQGTVDGGSDYYYSATTGKLVAIVVYRESQPTCLAGPSGFVVPRCDSHDLACPDAGPPPGYGGSAGYGGAPGSDAGGMSGSGGTDAGP